MATVNRRRSKRDDYDDDDDRPSRQQKGRKRKRSVRSHAFFWGSLVTLLIIVAIYLAPMIVGSTSLRNSLLQTALRMDGTITLGSASLGWFSPVVADDIQIRDADGEAAIEIAQFRTAKPLIQLLLDFGNVGLVEIDRPVVHAICHENSSNLERIFSAIVAEEETVKAAVEVKVIDGTVVINDVHRGRTFRVEQLAVDCKVADAEEPLMVQASGNLAGDARGAAFKVDLRTQRSEDGKNPMAAGKVACNSTAIPLEIADPILRRTVDGADLSGRVSTDLNGAWGKLAESGEASVQGEAIISDLSLAAKALGTDRLKLARVEIPCHVIQRGETLAIEQLGVMSELGNIALVGTLKMDDFAAEDKVAALLAETYQVNGELDLVALSRVLPETLRIKEGTEITSGKVRLAVASKLQNGEPAWTGEIGASHLGANANGKALVWENPLDVNFAAHKSPKGVILDKAECTSSFLHASAAGSLEDLTATASFDLARLVSELQQFADLSQLQLTGQGEARLVLKRAAGDKFDADGQLQITGFQFVPVAGGQPWKEDKVLATLDVDGQFEAEQLKRIHRAVATVDVGQERLSAELREPIVDPMTSPWPLVCNWRGQLAPWGPRLEAVAGVVGWQLNGQGQLQATVNCSRELVEIQRAQVDLAQLHAWGNGWFINEPTSTLVFVGDYKVPERKGKITEASFKAGSTNAVLRGASLAGTADGWKVDSGAAQLAAELVTLYRWRHDPRLPANWRVSGNIVANAEIGHEGHTTTARLDGTINQLLLVDLTTRGTGNAAGTWQEPQIKLAGVANYDGTSQVLKFERAQVASAALGVSASGVIPCSATGGNVEVNGTLQYDWQQLAPLWRPILGEHVQIAGNQTRSFNVRGKLAGSPMLADSWKAVTGDFGIGWTGMTLAGLQVGQGEVVANLSDGLIRTKPMDVTVSEGRLTFAPFARLTPAPAEFYIPQGPLLANVHLSPEMCKRGLKFVAPIVAETTVAEGRFSISMDGGRIPLADPKAADIAGHMAIRAQVKPGPVAQEFFVLLNELASVLKQGAFKPLDDQTGSLMSIDTSDVQFRVVQRRVYHSNLKFTLGTMPISTYGSVGMDDESLAMVAEIPLQAQLLGKDVSLGTMEGQKLQIPIGGTLSKPQLDRGALRQLTAQVLQNMTRGVLTNELGKQLDRILPFQRQTVPAP